MTSPALTRPRPAPALGAVAHPAARTAHAAAVVAIGLAAAALRLSGLGSMPLNPYYDAAVRSMGSSWHAFLVGAFNPNASVALDKPPLDLWLQVASTKVFGFTPFALHLPQALASTAAVLLLYDLVRRTLGGTAGLAAAAALAVLPVDVITSRSDTMDAVMTALLVLAAWLVVRALERGRGRELYLAGAVVGLAFETKLFEALVALPALALLYFLGSSAPVATRVRRLAGAGAAMVAVGLGWPLLFALLQTGGRPYPMGSTDGSVWSTVFGYNGLGRLQGTSTKSLADHLSTPSPVRLFTAGGLHLGALIGTSLAAALAVGLAAAAFGLVRRRRLGRLPFALTMAIGCWVIAGGAILSFMGHLEVRYLEVLAPAVAALFGIGIGLLARAGAPRLGVFATAAALVFATAALLAPASKSVAAVNARSSDGGAVGRMTPHDLNRVAGYLAAHRVAGARYEYATLEAHMAGSVIAADGQPVLVLAGTPYHPIVSPHQLAAAVRSGSVRYVLASDRPAPVPPRPSLHGHSVRGRMVAWIRLHGTDVTPRAGLPGYGMLYELTPQSVAGS